MVMAISLMACQPKEDSKVDSKAENNKQRRRGFFGLGTKCQYTGLYVAGRRLLQRTDLNVKIVQPSEDSASTLVANNRADFGIYFQPNMTSRLEKGCQLQQLPLFCSITQQAYCR